MFITPAFAQATADAAASTEAAAGGNLGMLTSMLPIILILCVFYFMVIRPQNKRMMDHRNLINNLQKGDKVVTAGGLVATVKKLVGEDEILLELAEGVQVHAIRSTIMTVRSKA